MINLSILAAPSSDSAPSVVVPAAIGGLLAISVIINIILVIIVAVLLINKGRKGSGVQSQQSVEVRVEVEASDIELKPNTVYDLNRDGIVTKPNMVYGVANRHVILSEPNIHTESQYEYVP